MCPFTHVHFLTFAAAVVASFMFGYLWYGPIFGKIWADLMKFKKGESKPKPWAIPLTFLGVVMTTTVLARIIYIYKPTSSLNIALLVWLGLSLPMLFSQITWEGKPLQLFGLNAAYYFLNLQLIAAILTYLR